MINFEDVKDFLLILAGIAIATYIPISLTFLISLGSENARYRMKFRVIEHYYEIKEEDFGWIE